MTQLYQQHNSELKTKLEYLERIKAEQKAEIEAQKLKLNEFKERLGGNSANSSLPPSSDSPFQQSQRRREISERKQGAPPSRKGVCRQLLPVTEIHRY